MLKNKKTSKTNMDNNNDCLVGKCLVYIGESENETFDHSVVYITESTPSGTKGIIINKLLFGTASIECKKNKSEDETSFKNVYEDLYQGGPENPAHGFVLFPTDDTTTSDPNAKIQGNIAISTSFGVLQEILDGIGPDKKIIAMGHCKWDKGELEWEIFNNKWLIIDTNTDLMFDTKFEEKWEKAKSLSSIDMKAYIKQSGTA
ncbi:MAG: YqgE/AlgH family protein [Alphaproteobacteria bacterium]|nr:YqgE/AlgH family protein [Alphaproteobacteria bacterium]